MNPRPPLIVGNWKMHKTTAEAAVFVRRLLELVPTPSIDVVLAPPFTALQAVGQALGASSPYTLGAQDVFWEDQGAYTGEISAPMLAEVGCRYVIIGHSERRHLFGETDEGVNKKIRASLRHDLRPIICVGESLAERERGNTLAVISDQLKKGLAGLSKADLSKITIAYEPVWAIGTGKAATPVQATAAHEALRRVLQELGGAESVSDTRILYGGSVTPENAAGFLSAPQVDGALVGGACLDPQSFAKILHLAKERASAL